LAAVTLAYSARGAEIQSTWNGGSGSWGNSAEWTPAGVPNNGANTYDVTINGTVFEEIRLGLSPTIENLNLNGPYVRAVGGSRTLTINDTLNWTSGQLIGDPSGSPVGSLTVIANGPVNLTGTGLYRIHGLFQNRGTATLAVTGVNPLQIYENSTWDNQTGSVFDIKTNAGISGVANSPGTFSNAGTFRKSGGTGESQVYGVFTNASTGVVQAQSGTMAFGGWQSQHGGSYSISPGATLKFFSAPQTFQSTATISGAGNLVFGSYGTTDIYGTINTTGNVDVAGGTAVFKPGVNMTQLGSQFRLIAVGGSQSHAVFETGAPVTLRNLSTDHSYLPGGAGYIYLRGPDDIITPDHVNWGGGTISSYSNAPPKFVVNGGMTISGTTQFQNRVLENNSTITWTGGHIYNTQSANIVNNAGAVIDIQTDYANNGDTWSYGQGKYNNRPVLTNDGTIKKTAGTSSVQIHGIQVNNSGLIESRSGSIEIAPDSSSTSGTSTGTFRVLSGAKMKVGQHTFAPQSRVEGAGEFAFGGDVNEFYGTLDVSGLVTAYGGTTFHPGAVVVAAGETARLDFSGRLTLNTGSTVAFNNLVVNGLLDGTDSISVSGRLSGAGTVKLNVVNDGVLAPGNSAGILTSQGSLVLQETSELEMELGGSSNAIQVRYDAVNSTNAVTLGGLLKLSTINGYVPSGTDVLTLIDAASPLAGAFANVVGGERLITLDGQVSWLVNYGAGTLRGTDKLVLSDPLLVPEPAALPLLGLAALLLRRGRRTR
jgi:fibronectin-binding autotransporter adhesin